MSLTEHLISLGGHGVFGDQILYDPDDEKILKFGRVFSENRKFINMEPNACHWNVSKLFLENRIDNIVIGYALSVKGEWFQHTWGLDNGVIIETSDVNFYNIDIYYGLVVDDPLSFSNFCESNPKGMGKVRRIYPPIDES